jgi:uncharacterized repeat protein (TIGR03803 family)
MPMNPRQNAFFTKWPMAIFIVVMILAGGVLAVGQTERVVYRFQDGSDGFQPQGGLITDQAGNFYGTTSVGGVGGGGTVFQLSPPAQQGGHWSKTVLYSFTGGNDGGFPFGELVFDQIGNLYGVTLGGGPAQAGTVFRLIPQGGTWTETVIYSFQYYDQPVGGLVFDKVGNLYGAHFSGGENNRGAVFQLTPSQGGGWTYAPIYSFGRGRQDGWPVAAPIIGESGNLYGMMNGGTDCDPCQGSVYELKHPASQGGVWTERVLYDFCSQSKCSDGAGPAGRLIFDRKGNLDGVTEFGGSGGVDGGGTVFQLTPHGGSWTESVLYNFCTQSKCTDGTEPLTGVILDGKGNLYGTTNLGGRCFGCGAAFELTPPAIQAGAWTETVLHSFTAGEDGAEPMAGLTRGKFGRLWGTTIAGGKNYFGTVFKIHP